ncbi:MAG: hypothetical protein EOP24_37470 [Hyphomicrobiales bacterium]|nr:MAG: hypothetical protein EOP24_37470 [Hyphomicrobiales bacterium]
MPVTVLQKSTQLSERGTTMPSRVRINETDQTEAARAVHALRQGNELVFRQVIDGAFTRYGGVERLLYVLTDQLAKSDR